MGDCITWRVMVRGSGSPSSTGMFFSREASSRTTSALGPPIASGVW